MPVGARHAAAARRLHHQLKIRAAKHLDPLLATGRHVGFFRAMGQQPEGCRARTRGDFVQAIKQPFLGQFNRGARLQAGDFLVFLAIDQGHRRVQPHQPHAAIAQGFELPGVTDRGFVESTEKPLYLQRFAVGAERRDVHLVAHACGQFDHGGQQRRFEIAGEGILHQHHAAADLRGAQLL